MLHIQKKQNILLKGIGLLSPAVGIRSQYENIKDQINEKVDQVIESLNKDESTNAIYSPVQICNPEFLALLTPLLTSIATTHIMALLILMVQSV